MNSQNKKKEKSGVSKNIQVSTVYEYHQIYKTNFGKILKGLGKTSGVVLEKFWEGTGNFRGLGLPGPIEHDGTDHLSL